MLFRPHNTYRFTICGAPKAYVSHPPNGLAVKLPPRKRFKIMVMPDDGIFFEELDTGAVVVERMLKDLFNGEFRWGMPRFEVKVGDLSDGLANYYEVRPLYYVRNYEKR